MRSGGGASGDGGAAFATSTGCSSGRLASTTGFSLVAVSGTAASFLAGSSSLRTDGLASRLLAASVLAVFVASLGIVHLALGRPQDEGSHGDDEGSAAPEPRERNAAARLCRGHGGLDAGRFGGTGDPRRIRVTGDRRVARGNDGRIRVGDDRRIGVCDDGRIGLARSRGLLAGSRHLRRPLAFARLEGGLLASLALLGFGSDAFLLLRGRGLVRALLRDCDTFPLALCGGFGGAHLRGRGLRLGIGLRARGGALLLECRAELLLEGRESLRRLGVMPPGSGPRLATERGIAFAQKVRRCFHVPARGTELADALLRGAGERLRFARGVEQRRLLQPLLERQAGFADRDQCLT